MKVNVKAELKKINGEALFVEKFEKGEMIETGTPFTLKTALVEALMANDTEENASGEEKLKRFMLAQKIQEGSDIDFKAEETVLLKKLVGKVYGPLVVGQVYQLLEKGKK